MTFRQRLALVICIWTVVLSWGGGSPFAPVVAAPFVTDKPCVLAVYDATPTAVAQLDKDHPGQADILSSLADGSARQRVAASGGEWRLLDKAQDVSQDSKWVQDAYGVWKPNGKVPWIVAASKTGGINQAPPETQAEMGKLLSPLGVK